MKKIALYVLMGASLLGCGSDDSRPGVMPGLPSGGTTTPSTPNDGDGGSNPDQPPTDSNTPPDGPGSKPDETKNDSLAGIYVGSAKNKTAKGIIDDDNNVWFVYGDNADLDINTGLVNANITALNGEMTGKGRDYASVDETAERVTIKGTYQKEVSINGTVTPDNSVLGDNYNLPYDKVLSSAQNFQTLARVANKTFDGRVYISKGGVDSAKVTVKSDGSFSGSSSEGCQVTGNFSFSKPNTQSAMYLVSTVRLGNDPCYPANQIFRGVAHLDDNDELIVVGVDDNKNRGLIFGGEKL